METIKKDLDEILSYEAKVDIIKSIGQDELIELFDDYKPKYKPIVRKKSPLDQQISVGITKAGKDQLISEVNRLKKSGSNVTISSLVRSRAVSGIDIEAWRERAEIGLVELNDEKWNKPLIERRLRALHSAYDALGEDEDEEEVIYRKKIAKYKLMLEELERPTEKRGASMSGRVTFNEANHIRWRAGRLTLTVADYMRFMIFGHLPFTENDRHLSIDARRRFYIAIIDVAENGWGEPPYIEECGNCARYAAENKELRAKLERLQKLSR